MPGNNDENEKTLGTETSTDSGAIHKPPVEGGAGPIGSNLGADGTRYRAACDSGHPLWNGPWHPKYEEALADCGRHNERCADKGAIVMTF